MLTQKTKDNLKKVFKMDVDKLLAAIADTAEVEFPVPEDASLLTAAELTDRDNNMRTAGKTDGESGAIAIAKKEIKTRLGLDIKGDRWGDITTEIKTKMDATDNDKIKTLNDQVTLLQSDKTKLEGELTSQKVINKAAQLDSELISYFPTNTNTDLTPSERLALVKLNLVIEEVDGKPVVKRNGTILRDTATQNPVTPKDAIEQLFTEKKWVSEGAGGEGGRGGRNSGGTGNGTAGIKSLSKFTDAWKLKNPGVNEISPEFDNDLAAHVKDKPDFDYNT
jgi:hypothetical protein